MGFINLIGKLFGGFWKFLEWFGPDCHPIDCCSPSFFGRQYLRSLSMLLDIRILGSVLAFWKTRHQAEVNYELAMLIL